MRTSGEGSCFFGWCLAGAEKDPPGYDGDRVQHDTQEVYDTTDRLVPLEPAGMIEEKGPVMLAAPHQRQFLGAGVSHIDGDVPTVLSQPPEGHRGTVAVASTPQRHCEDGRYDELEEGSAEDAQNLTIEAEYQMAGFVNGEIEAVEPTVGARRNQAKPAVHGQNYGEGNPPAPLLSRIMQDGLQVSWFLSGLNPRLELTGLAGQVRGGRCRRNELGFRGRELGSAIPSA
jgi:hypothetical protein